MAVSKRLRYEILRRDNHTCRYCGASAPAVPLRVDHVVPVALGGSDIPDNLVTSCEPCNSGKSSATVDASVVANVADDALRWAEALKQAAQVLTEQDLPKLSYRQTFLTAWQAWEIGRHSVRRSAELPADWKSSIDRFRTAGLPEESWDEIIEIAMTSPKVLPLNVFRYCCGIAWRRVSDLQQEARRILTTTSARPSETDHLLNGGAPHSWQEADFWAAAAESAWLHAWAIAADSDDWDHSPSQAEWDEFLDARAVLTEEGRSEGEIICAAVIAGTKQSSTLSWGLSLAQLRHAPVSWEQFTRMDGAREVWTASWNEAHGNEPSEQQQKEFRGGLVKAARRGYSNRQLLTAARSAAFSQNPDVEYFAYHVASMEPDSE
ncbi:HNH endonuclease [Streptomyces sp. NRRL F-2580]|uniref:HNH endonuclease n=1 Tax=Streptomyces sp. NRRL F-2580 TaxID=1463841 RepID=UPI0004CBF31A|nr:HNH endonuclease [Streptomyces sp. NRRL F-2580]